jgi:hypothetical protein
MACSNSSTTFPAPSSNARILSEAIVLLQLAQLVYVRKRALPADSSVPPRWSSSGEVLVHCAP